MRIPQRSAKAFTLIELIVVIVILGILALIAIPTFGKVIGKSQDESTLTTLRSIARDAQALRALDQGSTWGNAPQDAISETTSNAAGVGLLAAGVFTPVIDAGIDPKKGEVTYKVTDDSLVIAGLSGSGRICVVGANPTVSSTGKCFVASANNNVSTMVGAVNSDASLAPGFVGKPGAPTNVTATITGQTATVTWNAPASNGATVTGYTVTASTGQTTTVTTLSAQFTSLPAGVPVTFTVQANSANGSTPATSSSNSVTPAPASTLGGNILPIPAGTTASANTTYQTNVAGNAIDNNTGTDWISTGYNSTLTLTLPQALTLNGVYIHNGSEPNSTETFTVEGLKNGSWVQLGMVTVDKYKGRTTTPVTFASTTVTGIRVNVSSPSAWIAITEMGYTR